MNKFGFKKVKTMNSHTGFGRFLQEADETNEYIARAQVKTIPSPYAYSPVWGVLLWQGKKVLVFETRHRYYEVFELPEGFKTFHTYQEAEYSNL